MLQPVDTYIRWVVEPKQKPFMEIRKKDDDTVVKVVPLSIDVLYQRGMTPGQIYDRRI